MTCFKNSTWLQGEAYLTPQQHPHSHVVYQTSSAPTGPPLELQGERPGSSPRIPTAEVCGPRAFVATDRERPREVEASTQEGGVRRWRESSDCAVCISGSEFRPFNSCYPRANQFAFWFQPLWVAILSLATKEAMTNTLASRANCH